VLLKGGKDIFTGQQEIEEWLVKQIPYSELPGFGPSSHFYHRCKHYIPKPVDFGRMTFVATQRIDDI
jgi:hypothetical protein